MILKANELFELKKKVVIIPTFTSFDDSNDIDLNFKVYYDCGNGFASPFDDSETYAFAKEIKNQGYDEKDELFDLGANNEIIVRNLGIIKKINNEQNRINFIKKIYDFGKRIDAPLFMKINDEFFFVNQLKLENNQRREKLLSNFYLVELEKFMLDAMYGKDYKRKKAI